MNNKIVNTIKHIGLYFSASLIPMLLNLAINPLIALNMSPKDYAVTGFYTSFNMLLSPLIVFYMLHYYTKRYYEVSETERIALKTTLVKSLIYFSGFLSLLSFFALATYYFAAGISESFPFMPYAFLTVFSIPLTGLYTLTLTDYRMSKRSMDFFKVSITCGISLVLANLIFIVVLKWGAFGKLLAPFIINLIFFVYCLWKYRELLREKFDMEIFKKIILFCYPLTLAAMLTFFTNGYDRVLLEKHGNINELGIYVVGIQMATYISVFQNAISSTFQPDLYQAIVQNNKSKLLKVIALLIGGTAAVILCFILLAPFVIEILTAGRYVESTKYAQIAALSTLSSAMYYVVSQITIARGLTKIPLVNKIMTSIACIVMFYYFITRWGFIGAAWGLVMSHIVALVGNAILLYIYNIYNIYRKKWD